MTSLRESDTYESKNFEKLNFSWLFSNASSDIFKVLLVFPRDDQQSEILAGVARKLGWSVSQAKNAEEATELFHSHCHDLAIIDRRGSARSQDADEICRLLTNLNCSCNIVALVKKSYFTAPQKTQDDAILYLLNVGYNRALMECSHEGILMNELIGIYANESQPKSQLVSAQLLYLAVDRCRDIVHVTNEHHIVQFANRASEKILGYKLDDLVGRSLEEFVTNENFRLMDQQLRKGREFKGNVTWKRKAKGSLGINCRIIPLTVPANKTTYYVYLYESADSFESVTASSSFQQYSGQESIQSYRRPSYEIKFPSKRRQSVSGKLSNLPISKVISLLSSAMSDIDSIEVTELIQSAIEILKTPDLFSPNIKEDPVPMSDPTSDLLEALLAVSANDPRRSSNASIGRQSAIIKILNSNHHQMNAKMYKFLSHTHNTEELEQLLETCFDWDFDIFKLETLTNKRPLYYLGMMLMSHFRVAERLDCDDVTLQNWLTIIEANYNTHVYYHNSTHATDVLQAVARFMRSKRIQMILDPLDEVAALLAAASHDVGHPGKSSQFLCNANNKLAILYNDITVLESHHAALTFQITMSDDSVNIFKNLDDDVYRSVRQNVIDMILATEMTKHFEHLAKFVNVCSSRIGTTDCEGSDNDVQDTSVFLLPENVTLTKRIMIKCADVSNPTRSLKLYVEWTRRIAEEYFDQTDEEKMNNLPVVMPMFDRTSCSIPKSQMGFVDYIINDMMEAWDAFVDMPELIANMRENYQKWKEFYEQGISTLDDIVSLQERPDLRLYKDVSKNEK